MPKDKSKGGAAKRQHAPATTDPRFARLHTDPRFLRPQKDQAKVVLDDRFKGLLDGKDFGVNAKGRTKLDRFGRKKGKGMSKDEEEMRRLYRLGNGAGSGEDDDDGEERAGSDSAEDEEDGDSAEEDSFVDYARGVVDLESSSDEDSSSESDSEEDGSSSEDDEDVAIGRAAVLKKARRQPRYSEDSSDGSSVEEEDSPVEAESELTNMDPGALAELDAQANAALEQSKIAGTVAQSSRYSSSRKSRKAVETPTIPLGGETRRLAIVNLDWDHVRSIDLYKVFSSLVSPLAIRLPGPVMTSEANSNGNRRHQASTQVKGTVDLVRVYPSDFGRERMAREDIEGPPKEIFQKEEVEGTAKSRRKKKRSGKGKGRADDGGDYDDDSDDDIFEMDDGGDFDEEALRQYQLDRLRYYYAIATFDSPLSARHVYDEVDGTEMERTANIFDLRFVPDDLSFPDHQGGDKGWRDEAKPGVDDGIAYKGVDWSTDALRHSKVKLTWDAPDPERSKVTRRIAEGIVKNDQIRDEDFRAYLASDSEDEGGKTDVDDDVASSKRGPKSKPKKNDRDNFRALLGLDDSSKASSSAFGRRGHSNSAFDDFRGSDDEGAAGGGDGDMQITFLPGLSEAAARKADKSQDSAQKEETTLEKYLRKQREKRERKRGARAADDESAAPSTSAKATGNVDQDLGFDDPFFASANGEDDDLDTVLAKEKASRSVTGKDKRSQPVIDGPAAPVDADATEVEVDGDDDDRAHFDMKTILKQSKGDKKKLNRWEKKKLKKSSSSSDPAAAAAGKPEMQQPDFKMNLSDSRFFNSATEGDHRFAVDPTHPDFMATEGMKKLLDTRRTKGTLERGEEGREGQSAGKKRKNRT